MKTTKLWVVIVAALFSSTAHSQWVQLPGPQGGSVNCVEKVDNEIWTGTNCGIYVSTNEGVSWQKSYFMSTDRIKDIYSSGDTILIAFDSVPVSGFSYSTFTIVSFDKGLTWSIPAELSWFETTVNFSRVNNTIYNDKTVSFDFGMSWQDLMPVPDGNVGSVVSNNNTAMVSVVNFYSMYTSLFRSFDGMQTWQLIDSSESYGDLYMDDNILLCIYSNYDTVIQQSILRSTNLGQSWDTVLTLNPGLSLYGMFQSLGVLNVYVSDNGNYYGYTSNDSGLSWIQGPFPDLNFSNGVVISNGDVLFPWYSEGVKRYVPALDSIYPAFTGTAAHYITALAANKNVLFAGTLTELYRSSDAGLTWVASGLNLGQINDFVFVGDTVLAVSETNIVRSLDNGLNWDSLNKASYSPLDYTSIDKIGNRIYTVLDSFYYSDDFGVSWVSLPYNTHGHDELGYLRTLGTDLFAVSNDGIITKYNMLTQAWDSLTEFWSTGAHNGNMLCSVGGALVMTGRDELLVSIDNGQTWSNSPLTGIPYNNSGDKVIPRKIISTNGIWIGTGAWYGLFTSSDLGNTWQQLPPGGAEFAATGGLTLLNNILYTGSYYAGVWRRSGAFATIGGNVFYDENSNGTKDNGENGIKYSMVNTYPSGFTGTTDNQGNYNLYLDTYGDTLRPVKPSNLCTIVPDHYITAGAAQNRDFAIQMPANIADLSVDITSNTVFRPGFQTAILLTVQNKGSLPQTPLVQLVLDSAVYFESASPVAIVSGDTLSWSLNSLAFLNHEAITINVTTSLSAGLGTQVNCSAQVAPVIPDVMPSDNFAVLSEAVVGSYDPNDKRCVQGEQITPAQVQAGEEMIFIVRFQNTGTFQADFIRIADTLSSFFDLSTFRVISSSHDMRWSMSGQGVVDFYFDNILLPSSSQDEPNSHGFVKYGVKCKKSTDLGDGITNTAFIYFDFNPAIVTNTTATVVGVPLSLDEVQEDVPAFISNIFVYPNPTSDIINIEIEVLGNSAQIVDVFDINGVMIDQETIGINTFGINTSTYAAGFYLGVVRNKYGNAIGSFKFVVQH